MERVPAASGSPPTQEILDELVPLALGIPDRAARSRLLFLKLRKSLGSPRFDDLVLGLVSLTRNNHPAGARLLASFLDTTTIEARVVPPLSNLNSSRRIQLILQNDQRSANAFSRDWLGRVSKLTGLVEKLPRDQRPGSSPAADRPGYEHPWPVLRQALSDAIAVLRDGDSPDPGILVLTEDLLRLEVDALEERASRLAGIIDPFRVAAVQRLLPILGSLDPRIRDTRMFLSSLNAGDLDSTFRKQWSRALEVMEESEFRDLVAALGTLEVARPLADLLQHRVDQPRSIPSLAAGIDRLRQLGDALTAAGSVSACGDLLGAVELACRFDTERGVEIPLTGEEVESVAGILAETGPLTQIPQPPFLDDGVLVLPWPDSPGADPAWPHEFPAADVAEPAVTTGSGSIAEDEDVDAGRKDDLCSTEIKKLVMNSLQTTSVLLSYLNNAKVTAIPGLVAEIANRTRNPQIISTIANNRALYSGFANRDVPLACLRNPSNVSVKILRKFVHVKFVSKMDLKLMAQDKAGVRRELRREIEHYLVSLS